MSRLGMIGHCVDKICELVRAGANDRRTVLQIGYNLGRLSELTGLGREPFWDRWKQPVEAWDLPSLLRLADELAAAAKSWRQDPPAARES